ncbi:MAG: hypothetical protein C5B49_11295 [Bdellovibrio sp.]|nr:MAG: hypothetical protein C5B49_11295 [Bdellovibrio sp.]
MPDHERLFDEICGKLNELSHQRPSATPDRWPDRFNHLQSQLRKTQEDWKMAKAEIQERMRSFETISVAHGEMSQEIKRLSEQLEQERQNNGKLATDLAKALELNLKLQFDIEEMRTRASQMVTDERKHSQFLLEKNKGLSTELELSHALNQELRLELAKAHEKFQADRAQFDEEKGQLERSVKEAKDQAEAAQLRFDEMEALLHRKEAEAAERENDLRRQAEEIASLSETVKGCESHFSQQQDLIKQLTAAAEQRLTEFKLALDRKVIESNDYYSHLQQALTQIQVLRQENTALKEYVSKITALHHHV